jgi:hypothetical protein
MAKRPQWMGRDAREKNKKKKTGIIKKEKKGGHNVKWARGSIELVWSLSVEHWSIASCSSSFHLTSL